MFIKEYKKTSQIKLTGKFHFDMLNCNSFDIECLLRMWRLPLAWVL
jgi:hypothetical protein